MDRPWAKRLFVWAVALLPVLIVGVVLYLHALPPGLRPYVINLVGTVKMTEGDSPVEGDRPTFADPSFDDSTWKDARLPAFKLNTTKMVWVRRRFTLPPTLKDPKLNLYLAAGGLWAGAELYLNGELVGRADDHVRGVKIEDFGIEGWPIRPGIVRTGPDANVLALKTPKLLLHDSRLLVGDEKLLRPYVLFNVTFKGFFLKGSLGLLIFFAVLLGALYLQEEHAGERSRYRCAITMALSSILYLAVTCGFLPAQEFSPEHILLLFLSILALTLVFAEFLEIYFLKRASRMRFALRLVFGCLAVVLVVLYALGKDLAFHTFWDRVCGPSLVVPLLWGLTSAIRGARREWRALGPALASSAILYVLGGAADVLTAQQITSLPRLSPLVTGNLAIICSVMITSDFLKISYLNKELSTSLSESNVGLAEALARSQEAVRIKGEFVANVSHELRTPLNSIVNIPAGLLALFEERPTATCGSCGERFVLEAAETVSPDTRCPACKEQGALSVAPGWTFQGAPEDVVHHLQLLGQSAKRLLSLINDVLDFSKLEAGRMTLLLERFALAPLIDEVCSSLAPLAEPKRISLSLEGRDPELQLRADRVKLSQILVNLLGNAVKFSPEGAQVTVRCERDGDQVILSVIDRGIGIPAESQKLIFESFRQVDGSHTRKYGGTGLGLAITRQLVELLGGRISVESEPRRGSTFRVGLPLDGPQAIEPVQAAPVGSPKAILVVDDDLATIEAIKLALRPLGVAITGVTDPSLFMSALERAKPDLVILDVMMPRISGLSLLQQLRNTPKGRALPVLVTSGYHSNQPLVAAQRAAWLRKPWESSQLVAEVRALLTESQGSSGAPPRQAAGA